MTSAKAPKPGNKRSVGRLYNGLSEEQRRQERRRRFIEAGIQTFGRDGYAATTTRSLCAEAGLTQRYFYEAFDGLESLFVEVCLHLGDQLKSNILQAMGSSQNDALEVARAALYAYFRTIRDDPRVARILLMEIFTVSRLTEQLARDFMDELATLAHGTVVTKYPNLAAQGLSPRLLAVSLIGATHHMALSWILGGYQEPLEQVVATALLIYQTAEKNHQPPD